MSDLPWGDFSCWGGVRRTPAACDTLWRAAHDLYPGDNARMGYRRRDLRGRRWYRVASVGPQEQVLETLCENWHNFVQTKEETTHAIAYTAANHTAWFWRGIYG